MMKERTRNIKTQRVFSRLQIGLVFGFLLIYFVVIAYPLIWMVISSFKDTATIFGDTWGLPQEWKIGNYATAWDLGISSYFLNSVLVTTLTCFITVLISAFAAYALSRFEFKGKMFFFLLISAGLMFSPQVSLVPLYQLTQDLGIYNTYWALILPYVAFQIPLTVLLFRAHFLGIDKELEESAFLDGCTSMGVLFRIILPLSTPIVLTATVLISFFAWNEFMFSLVFLDDDSLKTIPTGLLAFRGAVSTNWGVMLAGLTISALPIVILFLLTQKYFISGLAEGGVKG
ncbi:ABC transporter permease [Virgibacillus indicus]|uniref:ABC transporter permease n=1 Tax=Virgibacillus indicus TaxID=2024554 RepID=A0A265N586_9BACI|nr:carbohydrate ABC transporter permease [Virgibacillus indicus]OZU87203.1 ABC transporter permease [Virgibacillus indicus]